jgi:hypothetical protein
MALRHLNFQPVKPKRDRHSIGGTLAALAVAGMIVARHATNEDVLELANGKAGYFLMRDVVSAAAQKTALEQEELYPDRGAFHLPYLQGGVVQADDHDEVWVEGAALLDASMDAATTIGCPVTSAAGKFAEVTTAATQEVLGTVVSNVAALNGGGGRRFLIKIHRDGRGTP